jgi:peptidoglycan/LPS O-acetylase OafA/YrhL
MTHSPDTTFDGQPHTRSPELDLMRCVAVFLVLFRHVLIVPETLPAMAQTIILELKRFGWIGVDLFFVLSGFLVSGLLFREHLRHGDIRPVSFLVRRALKLYPAFYVFLAISVPLVCIFNVFPVTVRGIVGEVFFVQNYVGSSWAHTWSLAVEEHFYLILTIGMTLMVRKGGGKGNPFRLVPYVAIGLVVGLTTVRAIVGYQYALGWDDLLLKSQYRFDSLFFGVFLSYLYQFHHDSFACWLRSHSRQILVCSCVFIAPALFYGLEDGPFMYTFGLTFLYLGFGGLLMLLMAHHSKQKEYALSRLSLFVAIGRHSYSIYLWHLFVYVFTVIAAEHLFGRSVSLLQIVVYFVGSIVLGVGMSKIIEQPVLRLRDKWILKRG